MIMYSVPELINKIKELWEGKVGYEWISEDAVTEILEQIDQYEKD